MARALLKFYNNHSTQNLAHKGFRKNCQVDKYYIHPERTSANNLNFEFFSKRFLLILGWDSKL